MKIKSIKKIVATAILTGTMLFGLATSAFALSYNNPNLAKLEGKSIQWEESFINKYNAGTDKYDPKMQSIAIKHYTLELKRYNAYKSTKYYKTSTKFRKYVDYSIKAATYEIKVYKLTSWDLNVDVKEWGFRLDRCSMSYELWN